MDTVVITPEEPRPAMPTDEGDEPVAEIALALVDAFTEAGDPERAEAYCRSTEPAVGRLFDCDDEVGIELVNHTFLVRGPER